MDEAKPEMSADDRFHMMIGRCIASWADVDDVLFQIFHACARGNLKQIAILYFRIGGLDGRIVTTGELVRSALPERDPPDGGHHHADVVTWKKLEKRVKEQLPVRRRIAHYPVQQPSRPWSSAFSDAFGPLRPHSIDASKHEKLRGKESNNKPQTIEDLENHLKAVREIRDDLMTFLSDRLPNHVAEPVQPDPQPPMDSPEETDPPK